MIKLIEPTYTGLSKLEINELSSSRVLRVEKLIEFLKTGPSNAKYIPNSLLRPKVVIDLNKDFSLLKARNTVLDEKLNINLNIEYQKEYNPNIQKVEIPSKYLLNLENTKALDDSFLILDDTLDNHVLEDNAYNPIVFYTNVNVRKI